MKVKDLIRDLLNVGEKGANVARIIRSEHTLLELLVQEKIGEQKNERFVQDFKTLADVLVQQIVFHDLSQKVKCSKKLEVYSVCKFKMEFQTKTECELIVFIICSLV